MTKYKLVCGSGHTFVFGPATWENLKTTDTATCGHCGKILMDIQTKVSDLNLQLGVGHEEVA